MSDPYHTPLDGRPPIFDLLPEIHPEALRSIDWPEEAVLAVCRVALEDWLRKDELSSIELINDNPDFGDVERDCVAAWRGPAEWLDGDGAAKEFRGATIHHALIRACHYVLDRNADRERKK